MLYVLDLPPLIPEIGNASEINTDGDLVVDEEGDSSPESESGVLKSKLSRKKQGKEALTGTQRLLMVTEKH